MQHKRQRTIAASYVDRNAFGVDQTSQDRADDMQFCGDRSDPDTYAHVEVVKNLCSAIVGLSQRLELKRQAIMMLQQEECEIATELAQAEQRWAASVVKATKSLSKRPAAKIITSDGVSTKTTDVSVSNQTPALEESPRVCAPLPGPPPPRVGSSNALRDGSLTYLSDRSPSPNVQTARQSPAAPLSPQEIARLISLQDKETFVFDECYAASPNAPSSDDEHIHDVQQAGNLPATDNTPPAADACMMPTSSSEPLAVGLQQQTLAPSPHDMVLLDDVNPIAAQLSIDEVMASTELPTTGDLQAQPSVTETDLAQVFFPDDDCFDLFLSSFDLGLKEAADEVAAFETQTGRESEQVANNKICMDEVAAATHREISRRLKERLLEQYPNVQLI